jgi:cytochrome c-type biogenesis protein CcmE
LVVASAVGYLAFAGARQGWAYYMTVEQFAHQPKYQNQRVKLCGTVAPDGLVVNRGRLVAEFALVGSGESSRVMVVYHGPIPDMFRAGCEAVVEGKLNAAGTFEADTLLTKCASKYDADHGRNPHTAGGAHAKTAEVPS